MGEVRQPINMTRLQGYKLVGGLLAVIGGICLYGPKFLAKPGEVSAIKVVPDSPTPKSNNFITVAAHPYSLALTSAEIEAELNVLVFRNVDKATLQRFNTLIRRWAKMDKIGAFDYVDSLASAELRCQGHQTLIEQLAPTDPIFLGERLLAEKTPDADSIRLLANLWSQADAPSALAWAERLQDGPEKDDALVSIRYQLAAADPIAASQMVTALPENSS